MEEINRYVDRREFIVLLRTEFIPVMVEDGHKDFILENQRDMFSKWTCFFYIRDGIMQVVNISNE